MSKFVTGNRMPMIAQAGELMKSADMKYMPDGENAFVSFSLPAQTSKWNKSTSQYDNSPTNWMNYSMFMKGDKAIKMVAHLMKGSFVAVTGAMMNISVGKDGKTYIKYEVDPYRGITIFDAAGKPVDTGIDDDYPQGDDSEPYDS